MKKQLIAGALLSLSLSAQATQIEFTDFSDLSDWQLNGATASIGNPVGGDTLRLTNNLSQSGSAFLTNTISLSNQASFSAAFDFQITNPIGWSDGDGQGADGIVFVVQTNSNTAGGSGGSIGYGGLSNSVGIEFDTWHNGNLGDIDGNHVGINLDGNIASVQQKAIAPRLNNGQVWSAWIDYDGVTDLLEVRVSNDGIRSTNAFMSRVVDLEGILGTSDAFIGFTSGTGAAGGSHDILNLTFEDDFNPIGVPAPATLGLFGLALLSLSRFGRKKR